MQRLVNKIALVTGAARGIGAAIADAFEHEGATVVRSDILEIDAPGSIGLDVRKEEEWQAAVAGILATHGALHILVNNAGITGFDRDRGPQDPEHATLEAWREVHRTNLDGTFLGCKHAIRAMKAARKCAIINIGSRSGVVGIPPAAIRTSMWDGMELPARMGEPSDVAELAVYLASPAAAYVTGAEFNLDGGLLAGAAAPPAPVKT